MDSPHIESQEHRENLAKGRRLFLEGDACRAALAIASEASAGCVSKCPGECAWPAIPGPGNRLDGGRIHGGWRRAGRRCGQHDYRLRNRRDRPWRPHAFGYLPDPACIILGLGVGRVVPERLSKGKCMQSTRCAWPLLPQVTTAPQSLGRGVAGGVGQG